MKNKRQGTRDKQALDALHVRRQLFTLVTCHLSLVTRNGGFTLVEMMMGTSVMAIVFAALMGGFLGQSYLSQNARSLTSAMSDATRVLEQIRQQNSAANCPASGLPSASPPTPFASWNEWFNTLTTAPVPGGGPKSIRPTQNVADRDRFELVTVTCQDGTVQTCQTGLTMSCPNSTQTVECPAQGAAPVRCPDGTGFAPVAPYCGTQSPGGGERAQVGAGEWLPWYQGAPTGGRQLMVTSFNPIRVTVAVGWHQQQRVMSGSTRGAEFTYVPPSQTVRKATRTTNPERFNVGPDADNDGVIESQAMLTTLVTCR